MAERVMLTQRQLAFCENYVAGMAAGPAAIAAGYAPSAAISGSGGITAMLRHPRIVARIEYLRAEQSKRLNLTLDNLLIDLWVDREACRKLNRPEGAASITVKMATLLGFMKDKLPGETTFISMAVAKPTKQIEMSVDEWAAKWSPKEVDHHPTHAPHNDDHTNGNGKIDKDIDLIEIEDGEDDA